MFSLNAKYSYVGYFIETLTYHVLFDGQRRVIDFQHDSRLVVLGAKLIGEGLVNKSWRGCLQGLLGLDSAPTQCATHAVAGVERKEHYEPSCCPIAWCKCTNRNDQTQKSDRFDSCLSQSTSTD